MDDHLLSRYNRHLMMPQVDYAGQQKITQSRVFIQGAGGLGSPVAMYLASSGLGHIVIADFDRVEDSNLQRQILHTEHDIGRLKVESAADTIRALNPHVHVTSFDRALEGEELRQQVRLADAVVETSDNFAARFALNRACVMEKKPLISASVIRMEGQVSVFRNEREDSPCYNCLYRDNGELGETCTQNGVLAPAVGIIGSIQATETLKVLMGVGEDLCGRLLLMDAYSMEFRSLKLSKDPACPTCGQH